MNTVTSIFEQAQLAEAAYANFNSGASGLVATQGELQAALEANDFSKKQASEFIQHWKVVDHVPDLNSGFSATIFEHLNAGQPTGQYSLAIRGSTFDQGALDFVQDANVIISDGIAIRQMVDLYNFWQRARTPATTPDGQLQTYTAAVLETVTSGPLDNAVISGAAYTVKFIPSTQLADSQLHSGSGVQGNRGQYTYFLRANRVGPS